jgi:hypothetical protein
MQNGAKVADYASIICIGKINSHDLACDAAILWTPTCAAIRGPENRAICPDYGARICISKIHAQKETG